jgi:hypothetical protein
MKRSADFGCCDAKNVDLGIKELEKVLADPTKKGGKYYQKYQKCLKSAFPEFTVTCVNDLKDCGSFPQTGSKIIRISPNASKGRRSKGCGPVAATLVHELTHYCFWADPGGPEIEDHKDAFGVECELFGSGCEVARSRNPIPYNNPYR